MENPAGKTVWILGSGFSKPLGGPLLCDLFRQERTEDILPFFPQADYPDLAESFPWVQLCFNNGVKEGLWGNAEQFLAYVDDGYTGAVLAKRARIKNLIDRSEVSTASELLLASGGEERLRQYYAYKEAMPESFDRKVKRALAAECCRFLMVTDLTSELGLPYRNWVKTLRPGVDTVLSFNYDRVVESAAAVANVESKVWIAMPGQQQPPDCVPVLKLHGSVDWLVEEDLAGKSNERLADKTTPSTEILRSPEDRIAIAAPGGSKARFVRKYLEPLWHLAETALTEASQVIVVGYSFPETDPSAQYRLLQSFADGTPPIRWAHVVLGPNTTSSSRRMLSLLRSTAGNRAVKVSEFPELASTPRYLGIVQHPLGTQDFIGRRESFTGFMRPAP
jgi:hypothetical protein